MLFTVFDEPLFSKLCKMSIEESSYISVRNKKDTDVL